MTLSSSSSSSSSSSCGSDRAQELCDSRGGRPGLPVPDKPYGFCGRKATLNHLNQCASVVVRSSDGDIDKNRRVCPSVSGDE